MLIAQITDTHVTAAGTLAYGKVDSNRALAAAVAHLNALRPRPDLVLITGDLVSDGRPDQYAALRALLAPLEPPCRLLPGNHDEREALRSAFPDHAYLPREGPFLHYVVEDLPRRVIALDTVIPGRPEGGLCPRRLGWLLKRLAEAPERPTLIAMHHPPVDTGIAHMDAMRCFHDGVLGTLVARFPAIAGIVAGHVHRPVMVPWRGTVVRVCPSTAFQVGLTLGPGGGAWATDEPPAAALHSWRSDSGLVSHLSFIGDYRVTPFG